MDLKYKRVLLKLSGEVLSGEKGLRSRNMTLNGKVLALGENDELPALEPVKASGKLEIPATNCAFIVL